jgi:hypothetical protein
LDQQYEWLKTADFESAIESNPGVRYFDVRFADNQEVILTRKQIETLLRDRQIFIKSVEMGVALNVTIGDSDFEKLIYRPRWVHGT